MEVTDLDGWVSAHYNVRTGDIVYNKYTHLFLYLKLPTAALSSPPQPQQECLLGTIFSCGLIQYLRLCCTKWKQTWCMFILRKEHVTPVLNLVYDRSIRSCTRQLWHHHSLVNIYTNVCRLAASQKRHPHVLNRRRQNRKQSDREAPAPHFSSFPASVSLRSGTGSNTCEARGGVNLSKP